jgi:hypothetical protein
MLFFYSFQTQCLLKYIENWQKLFIFLAGERRRRSQNETGGNETERGRRNHEKTFG